ncbi:MAG: lactate utilization protein [Candidatus Marinimicrobia bacterium]|nr:lactate utilization protein [Candidatus Neomarinimicrobiota bacterium]MBL7047095.1 lactate utilization protein [Candidatus Neomarinimicrobiota bacterium]
MKQKIKDLIERLGGNNIPTFYMKDRKDAFGKIMSMIPESSTVGIGDSVTLRQIGVVDALEKGNYVFLNPWKPKISFEEGINLKKRALTSDVFVTGTNALTLDGKIVNVDGLGNRIAAMLFGPDKVIIVIGINKIVEDLKTALKRIRNLAAPLNVKRHSEFNPMPPCGDTGECSDCNSLWRICNKTVIIERQYDNDKYGPVITIVIVGEELGI